MSIPLYFEQPSANSAPEARRVVEKFEWVLTAGDPPPMDLLVPRQTWLSRFEIPDGECRTTEFRRHVSALDPHWQWLLKPFCYAGAPTAKEENVLADPVNAPVIYELFGDDRAPAMAYLAATNPRLISRGDWARIAFFDDPGEELAHPYSPGFLEDVERRYCYNRFWHPDADGQHDWMSTRYTLCGYGFAMVGSASEAEFTNVDSGILSHFRHHYALMGLLVHVQHAVLLSLSHRLARAVDQFARHLESTERFHGEVQKIHSDFLRMHRFWFEDITGQIQGQVQEFVAIDRFTGGVSGEKKFDAERPDRAVLRGRLEIEPERMCSWGLGLLALLARDLIEGDIDFGLGKGKGFGACVARLEDYTTAANFGWLRTLAGTDDAGIASDPENEPLRTLVSDKVKELGDLEPFRFESEEGSHA